MFVYNMLKLYMYKCGCHGLSDLSGNLYGTGEIKVLVDVFFNNLDVLMRL